MRAISLMQPWASLVAMGAKRIETRSWRHCIRGELAIHASMTFKEAQRLLCDQSPFNSYVHYWNALPFGAVVAVVHLAEITRSEIALPILKALPDGAQEIAFGDYSPKRFAWYFKGVQRLVHPVPAKGARGVFELSDSVESQVRKQLATSVAANMEAPVA